MALQEIEATFWSHVVNCDECMDKGIGVLCHMRQLGQLSMRDVDEALQEHKRNVEKWNSKKRKSK